MAKQSFEPAFRDRILDDLVARIRQVVQPRRIILFGSGAREDLGPDSDLDLLVVVQGPVHRRALAQAIYRRLHGVPLPVDIIVATEDDVKAYGDRIGTTLRAALREGRTIFESPA